MPAGDQAPEAGPVAPANWPESDDDEDDAAQLTTNVEVRWMYVPLVAFAENAPLKTPAG